MYNVLTYCIEIEHQQNEKLTHYNGETVVDN